MFHHKLMTPAKVVIWQLPEETPAEDIANELVVVANDGYSTPASTMLKTFNIPSPLASLTRNEKWVEVLKLSSLSHVVIKIEGNRAQADLKQCYNCQKFEYVWTKFRQPPAVVRVAEVAISTKSALERAMSTQRPAATTIHLNYRGCSHAKEKLLCTKKQNAPTAKNPPESLLLQAHNPSNFLRCISPLRSAGTTDEVASATASAGLGNEETGSNATICTTVRSVGRSDWTGSSTTTVCTTARSVSQSWRQILKIPL